jgi:hypothetical protein
VLANGALGLPAGYLLKTIWTRWNSTKRCG